jgi:hypothetical protein
LMIERIPRSRSPPFSFHYMSFSKPTSRDIWGVSRCTPMKQPFVAVLRAALQPP